MFSTSPFLPQFGCGCGSGINLFAERTKWFGREDGFDRQVEEARQFEDEIQGGGVVSAFEETDRLRMDPDLTSENLAAQRTLRAKNGDAVVNHSRTIRQHLVVDAQQPAICAVLAIPSAGL